MPPAPRPKAQARQKTPAVGLDRSKALLIFRAISAPLAHRGERARLAVAVLVAALLGLDVRVDPVRERGGPARCPRPGRDRSVRRESLAAMRKRKLNLYYGTVKSASGGRHFMAWADSREHALDLVEAALTVTEPVQGSVVGPVASLPADVMKPGVFVEVTLAPKD